MAPVQYIHQGGVRVCTVVLRKYRSLQSDLVFEEYSNATFRNPTPTMLGTMGSPNLCNKAVWTPIRQRRSASCTGLRGNPYGNISQQAGQMRIAVVPKYLLRQSSPLGVVYSHVHYRNCTATGQGAAALPSLRTKAVALVR